MYRDKNKMKGKGTGSVSRAFNYERKTHDPEFVEKNREYSKQCDLERCCLFPQKN